MTGYAPRPDWRALARRPLRRGAIGMLILALVTAALAWYIGMDPWHAVLVAAVVIAIGLAWMLAPAGPASTWPVEVSARADGNRADVARLSWTLRTRRGRVQPGALVRVRLLASRRLEQRGLDLDAPDDEAAVTALIGSGAYRILRPNPAALPRLDQIEGCLDALTRMYDPNAAVVDPPTTAATSRFGRVFEAADTRLTDLVSRRKAP